MYAGGVREIPVRQAKGPGSTVFWILSGRKERRVEPPSEPGEWKDSRVRCSNGLSGFTPIGLFVLGAFLLLSPSFPLWSGKPRPPHSGRNFMARNGRRRIPGPRRGASGFRQPQPRNPPRGDEWGFETIRVRLQGTLSPWDRCRSPRFREMALRTRPAPTGSPGFVCRRYPAGRWICAR